MARDLSIDARRTGPDLLPAESSAPGHIMRAMGLAPGAPVPQVRKATSPYARISWSQVLRWTPLFVLVLLVNLIFSVPPLLLWREALRQTGDVFFGEEARLPWEG